MTESKVVMTDPRRQDYFYEEAIKTLRTNVQFTGAEIKTIVLTSCYPNEGKSDIAFHLAFEMGKMGKNTIIVDADIRKSSFIKRFHVKGRIEGLSQYLSGQCQMEDIVYQTNFTGVDIVFSGPVAPNPSELLGQESFSAMVQALREKYDYVLIDTPPIANLIDAAVVAGQCDGAILVIESDAVSRKIAIKAREQLEVSGCRMLGAVLNKVDVKKTNKYYSKYGYYGKTKQK